MYDSFEDLGKQIDLLTSKNLDLELRLEESLTTKILELEDIGWEPLTGRRGVDERGLALSDLHSVVPHLRDLAASNPLHVRGAQLRHAYVFGRGIEFSNMSPRAKKALANPYNQDALFSVSAHETNNLEDFNAGNFFLIRDESTDIFTVIPLEEIAAEITDPDDESRVRFFLRTWSSVDSRGKPVTKKRWYPLSRYKKTLVGRGKRTGGIPDTITLTSTNEAVPVDQGSVMYHKASRRQAGWVYGIPASLAAAVFTRAYSEYLRDNAALVKALQKIAWSITSSTKAGANSAAVAIARPGVGGSATMGSGNTLSSVGVPSAQVDMNNGQPLAAMVATSFGVPVIALLSSPGATGGSYGAATTLDLPTVKTMTAVQDSWKMLYVEILGDLGAIDAEVSFPSIEQDPAYREIQSILQAKEAGLLHQDEAREGVLRVLDVPRLHAEMPPDNADFTTPSQGNTGSVPGGFDQNTTNNDAVG